MVDYLFFLPADEAQDDIWQYTFDTWGKDQAIKYIRQLHDHLGMLARKEKYWFPLPQKIVVPSDLDIEAFFSRYEHHYIFFRKLTDDNIGIMSILHESADIPVNLIEDLRRIETR